MKLERVPTCAAGTPCLAPSMRSGSSSAMVASCPCCFYQGSENKLGVWLLPPAFAPRWALGDWEWPCPGQVFLTRYKEGTFLSVGVQMFCSLVKRPENLCATPIKSVWQSRAASCNTAWLSCWLRSDSKLKCSKILRFGLYKHSTSIFARHWAHLCLKVLPEAQRAWFLWSFSFC